MLYIGKEDLLTDYWHFNQGRVVCVCCVCVCAMCLISLSVLPSEALQEYILYCCQHSKGGLIDKPSKYVLKPYSKISLIMTL